MRFESYAGPDTTSATVATSSRMKTHILNRDMTRRQESKFARQILAVIVGFVTIVVLSNAPNLDTTDGGSMAVAAASPLYQQYLSRRPTVGNCKQPSIKNGIAIFKQRRKLVRFKCSKGYQLMGNQYAGCHNGKWDSQISVCAKRGCRRPTAPENGFLRDERGGLMLSLYCQDSHQVVGNRLAYCDGENWDRTMGTCREISKTIQKWCDFETDDMCGWVHDDTSSFEWKRLPSFEAHAMHTGPRNDHTYSEAAKGHYLMVETMDAMDDDRARLISPIYEANESIDACFSFYYFMYGASVGTVRVYVMPQSIDLQTMLEESRYLLFNQSGNQRNFWHNANFNIDQFNEPFQIIIEAAPSLHGGRLAHLGDIAIDDVALLRGINCTREQFATTMTMSTGVTGSTLADRVIYDFQSCNGRCNETEPTKSKDRLAANSGIIKSCNCHEECDDMLSCCPDYRNVCVFGITQFTDDTEEIIAETPTTIWRASTTTAATIISWTTNIPMTTILTIQKPITVPRFQADQSTSSRPPDALTTSTAIVVMLQDDPGKLNDGNTIGTQLLQQKSFPINDAAAGAGPGPILAIIVAALLVVAVLAIGIFGTWYYRKNYGPENYRKNVDAMNRRRQNANLESTGEFSDVLYLAEDEQIDFTLQTTTATIIEPAVTSRQSCPSASHSDCPRTNL